MSKDLKDTNGYKVAVWLRDEGRYEDGLPNYTELIRLVNELTEDD